VIVHAAVIAAVVGVVVLAVLAIGWTRGDRPATGRWYEDEFGDDPR
jgi:hypothetical protein